jgi:hypothetical protein
MRLDQVKVGGRREEEMEREICQQREDVVEWGVDVTYIFVFEKRRDRKMDRKLDRR